MSKIIPKKIKFKVEESGELIGYGLNFYFVAEDNSYITVGYEDFLCFSEGQVYESSRRKI